MKNLLALSAALALAACGAPDAEFEEELGQLEQPIFHHIGYGSEVGNTLQCIAPWSGGKCNIPDKKHFDIKVVTSNCGSADSGIVATSMFAALNSFENWLEQTPVGQSGEWGLTQRAANYQFATDFTINCTTSGGTYTQISTFPGDQECHSNANGQLCQYRKGSIKIDRNMIANLPGYGNANLTQKGRIIQNMIRHELGHMYGLGHTGFDNCASLMSTPFPGFTSNPVPSCWTNSLFPSSAEVNFMDCYNEDSGTSNDCGI